MTSPDPCIPPDFHCRRCGNCCKKEGFVRVSDEEIDRAAALLGCSTSDFIDHFTRLAPDRKSLSLTDDAVTGFCIFYDDVQRVCRIQNAKPQQCCDFPFRWRFDGWEKVCAGARGSEEKC